MSFMRFLARVGTCAAALLIAAGSAGAADPPKKDDRQAQLDLIDELAPHPDLEWLRRSKVPTDDAGLAKFLDGLRGAERDPAEVDRLVTQLRTGMKDEQDAATNRLAEIGPVAVPALRRHRLDPDAGAGRVRACLEGIEEKFDKPLARPAMRRLVWRRAPGAAAALLGYVPFAYDPDAELDAWYGLDELAEKDPKTLAVLAGALEDRQPARRAVAACILGRRGAAAQKKAVAGLLNDPSPEVRLRAAQGLLAGRNTAGVPELIDLLADAGIEIRWQAEELLRWLAVDTAPDALVGTGAPKAVAAAQAAWKKWWKDQGEKADVAAAEREPRRPLLLLAYDRKGGRAWVVGCDGVTRHEWKDLARLADARYVPGGSVLSLHEQPVREKPLLAERDLSGKPLWQYDDMRDPQYVQRLGNGHIFVAERQDIAEPYLAYQMIGPGGRVIGNRPQQCTAPARSHAFLMLDDGRIVTSWQYAPPGAVKTSFNTLEEYAPDTDKTRELWVTGHYVGEKAYLESNLDGGYLLSGLSPMSNVREGTIEIHEYDWDGDTFWKYHAPGLVHASRLRGGTTVGCAEGRIIEISADRRMVGELPMENPPAVARACLGLARFGFDTFPIDADLETNVDYRVRSLTKKDPKARLFSLRQLAGFRWWAARAIPKLKVFAEDPDPAVRTALRETLISIGEEEIPRLINEAKDPKRRVAAIGRLGGHCNGPGVLDALISALQDENPKVRSMAVASLGLCEQGSQSHPVSTVWVYRGSADKVLPAVLKTLKDPEARVKWEAIRTLGAMGASAKSAVPELIGILKNDKLAISRSLAAASLGSVGDNSPVVVAALYSALAESDEPRVTIAAADGLRQLRPPPADVAGKLIEAYRKAGDKDAKDAADIRLTCLTTLRHLHAADSETKNFMKALMADPTQDVGTRLNALWCLFDIPTERAAAYEFVSNWARREPDTTTRARLQRQVRGQKSLLNQTRASLEQ